MKKFSNESPEKGFSLENETTDKLNANILNNIDVFIFIFDYQQGIPIWINKFFRYRMGYSKEELKLLDANAFLNLFHPNSIPRFQRRMKFFEMEDEGLKTIYQLKAKSGKWIHLLISSKVHSRKSDGSIQTLIGYGIEINGNELRNHLSQLNELESAQNSLPITNKLSKREKEIIHFIVKGLTDKEIAEHLGISIHTTKTHRKRIISKLGVKNTASLVGFAIQNGLS